MTVHQGIALRTAGVFFGTWLLLALALAIADFPPPPGFVIMLLILLACAIALLSLFSAGEPSIRPELSDRLIGIGVLFGLGIGNALAAYAFGSWLHRRRRD